MSPSPTLTQIARRSQKLAALQHYVSGRTMHGPTIGVGCGLQQVDLGFYAAESSFFRPLFRDEQLPGDLYITHVSHIPV